MKWVPNESNALLDHLIERFNLKNDAHLSRKLEVAPPVISKIRHKLLGVGAVMILRIHDVFGISVADIRKLIESGDAS